jgi:two-component system, chemotaxis family, protein-glutamate methylesterase/glutaminase
MKTRVLLVDDSPLIRAVLREAFERTHDIEVVGEAGDGRQAIECVRELRPDVVTMDVVMPVMDGLRSTEEIMRVRPTPIVIIARDGGNIRALGVEALGKGALAVFPKPAAGFDDPLALELAVTIRRLASEAAQSRCFFPSSTTPTEKIRVLLVDDSSLIRQVMRRALAQVPDIDVVAEAKDGVAAVRLATELRPDVVCLDLLMPIMGGQETVQHLLHHSGPGVLLVTRDRAAAQSLLSKQSPGTPIDVFLKPSAGFDEISGAGLAGAIRRLAQAKASRAALVTSPQPRVDPIHPTQMAIAGIVGSTGAPRVLRDLVCGLPADFPVPIVLVQHTERGYAEPFAHWLSAESPLPIRLGREGDMLVPGEIVMAPDDAHMEIHTGGVVALRATPAVNGFRPSGTVLLTSLAAAFGQHSLGLVLSGMGSDGAEGLGAIYSAGGCAIVEDPETATVPGMPKRALARATGAHVERASRLAWLLIELAGSGRSWKLA